MTTHTDPGDNPPHPAIVPQDVPPTSMNTVPRNKLQDLTAGKWSGGGREGTRRLLRVSLFIC